MRHGQGVYSPGYTHRVEFRDEGPKLRQRFEPSKTLAVDTDAGTADLPDTEGQHGERPIDLSEVENGGRIGFTYLDPATPLLSPVVHQQQLLHTFIWSMTASHQNDLSPALGTYCWLHPGTQRLTSYSI